MDNLQKYFDKAESNHINFKGKCHDCGGDTLIKVDVEEGGELTIAGGALYFIEGVEQAFVKCDVCFNTDHILHNFQECLVYSRVVGFLTPVRDWNDGKQSEWKDRKVFRVPN